MRSKTAKQNREAKPRSKIAKQNCEAKLRSETAKQNSEAKLRSKRAKQHFEAKPRSNTAKQKTINNALDDGYYDVIVPPRAPTQKAAIVDEAPPAKIPVAVDATIPSKMIAGITAGNLPKARDDGYYDAIVPPRAPTQ